MSALQGDPWRISPDERAKHDMQFFQLKPVGDFVTGDQAKGFFMQSGLPMAVLGQIWGLADLNADGKMDKLEFSIAMHLIAKKLQGLDLPSTLPISMKGEHTTSPTGLHGNNTLSSGFSSLPYNSMSASIGFSTLSTPSLTKPGSTPSCFQLGGASDAFGTTQPQESRTQTPLGMDWGIPQHKRVQYNQLFSAEDRARKGHLNGNEAKNILSKTGLSHTLLAQIWNLSDLDSDGKLTADEFLVCMFLVDTAKSGQPLPRNLPPELIPPSYRSRIKGDTSSGMIPSLNLSSSAVPSIQPSQNTDAFGDMFGLNMSGSRPIAPDISLDVQPDILPSVGTAATFEDKRKENFDKGQAELERRRAMLHEEQRRMEEERLAAEKAEHEKREKKRMEQERKKQIELEKQMEKQRHIEMDREEARRKALEQREAARRELERQRQLEWERQRRDQLMAEKARERSQVDRIQSEVGQLKLELEAQDNKKTELHSKIDQTRKTITDLTSTIDSMRISRDIKVSDIEKLQHEVQGWQTKLGNIQYERQQLDIKAQALTESMDDSYKTVMHSLNSKKEHIANLQAQRTRFDEERQQKRTEADSSKCLFNDINNKLNNVRTTTDQLQDTLLEKRNEWNNIKQAKESDENQTNEKVNGFNSWSFETAETKKPLVTRSSALQDAWTSFSMITTSSTNSSKPFSNEKIAWSNELDSQDTFSQSSQIPSSHSASSWADSFLNSTSDQGSAPTCSEQKLGYKKYCAMFQFDARNPDELSLTPGSIVWVGPAQDGAEPGWINGECNGKEGWFPEAYIQVFDEKQVSSTPPQSSLDIPSPKTEVTAKDDFEPSQLHVSDKSLERNVDDVQIPGSLQSAESSFTAVSSVPSGSPTPGQGLSAPEGLQAQALYPWKAKKDNHLTFNKGDIILIKEQQDMWWSGELNDKIGWFPKSYVKLFGTTTTVSKERDAGNPVIPSNSELNSPQENVDIAHSPPEFDITGEKHLAMFAYQSAETGDLSFNQSDFIMVTKKDGDWWTGIIDGRTGIFPASYVKVPDPTVDIEISTSVQSEEQPQSPVKAEQDSAMQKLSSVKKPEIATVIAPYQGTGPEQLSLTPGQLILVRKKSPSGWWEGELQARGQKRKVGWFPANYVSLRGASSRSTPDGARGSPQKSLSPTPQPTDQGSRSTTPVSYPQPTTAPALEQVAAMYNYAAQNPDELNFHKGSIINVICKNDPDWWKGELNGETGVFPSNYVSPLSEVEHMAPAPSICSPSTDLGTDKQLSKQKCIRELIETEESYLKDLLVVRDVFYKPFNSEKVLTDNEKQTIFVNWKELVMCSTKLVKAFRVRRKMSKGQDIYMIGDILCENIPHLTPYIRFCSCQLNAAIMIQQKTENDKLFQDVHKRCWMDTRTKGMPLSSFMLKPMQRITKYPLLIEKLLEHTPFENHDYPNLEDALTKAQELCSQVNESVREQENSDKLEWIQTHVLCESLPEKVSFNTVTNCLGPRKYIHSGTLYKAKSGKELVGFLFNDFFLLTQPQRSMGNVTTVFSFDVKTNVTFKMYRNPIFLNEIMVKFPNIQDHVDNNILFHLNHIDRVYSLKAVNSTERDLWVKKIESASKQYLETERKKQERAHQARVNQTKGCGRLLVIVIEGEQLTPTDSNGKSDPYCEVSMGAQEHRTKVISNTLNPKWNASMQFIIKDPQEDVLCITVYDRDLFTPNDFLGRTEVRVEDILSETKVSKGPITKKLTLHEVDSGQVQVKLDLQIFRN